MRNLIKTLATVSLLVPSSAYSLGIGDIKLHSALNQNLNAEIALIVTEKDNLAGLQVKLAPPEKFDEAGVPWSYFLSKIKFKQIQRADGSSIIQLTSTEALREPFLDFLLEVSWDKGNLYREFTVLVDPPAVYKAPTYPAIEQTATDNYRFNDNAPMTTNGLYRATRTSDTLWSIAKNTQYQGVSTEQMVMGIYKANPNAFHKDNINHLLKGKSLKIPEKEVILRQSRRQAATHFKKLTQGWSGKVVSSKTSTPRNAKKSQLQLEAPTRDNVKANSHIVSTNDNSTSNGTTPQTALSIDSKNVAVELQARMEKLEQQLLMMQKMLILKDEQIAILQNKTPLPVAEQNTNNTVNPANSTDQPTENKPEITPPNSNSDLKNPADKEPTTNSPESDNKRPTESALPDNKQPIDDSKANAINKKDPTVSTVAPIKPVITKKPAPIKKPILPIKQVEPEEGFFTNTMTLALLGAGLGLFTLIGWLWWRKQKNEAELETESLFAAAGGINVPSASYSDDSSTATSFADNSNLLPSDDSTSYQLGTNGESSFFSEFTSSDFDGFQSDESDVDPIAEADVYLAYGRYQQAEELMRQAVIDQPTRDECKLKLLEIIHANEDAEGFEKYATDLIAEEKHNDVSFWSKVIAMGQELVPDSSLFTEEGANNFSTDDSSATVALAKTAVNQPEEVIEDEEGEAVEEENALNFDLSIFDQDYSEEELETESDNALDFDLSAFDMDASKKEEPEEDDDLAATNFDFDTLSLDSLDDDTPDIDTVTETPSTNELDLFDLDQQSDKLESVNFEEQPLEDSSTKESSLNDALDVIEFDLDLEPSSLEKVDTNEISLEEIESLDFNFDELSSVESSEQILPTEDIESLEFSIDESLTPNLETAIPEPVEESIDLELLSSAEITEPEINQSTSDLMGLDDLETKIDVSKAYIDMEDFESARPILQEVIDQGSKEQKTKAQTMVDQMK